MAFAFTENAGVLEYRERRSPLVRAFIALMGLAMFVIPIPFVQHGRWTTPSFETLIPIAGVVLPVLVGAMCLGIALSRVTLLRFDAAHRLMRHTTQGPLGRHQAEIGYERIERIEVAMRETMDSPPYYRVVLTVAGLRPMELGSFAKRSEAEYWQHRIEAQVHS